MPPRIRIGVVGWTYPEWKGTVYPATAKPAEFLRLYAERFPIVEAASAYYGMPKTETVAAWAEAVPNGFALSMKVPDWIVRKKPSDEDLPRALGTLMAHLEPLASTGKLGTLVVQFHPSFHYEKRAEDLAAYVALLPKGPRWAVELRHASWWREETYDLLRKAGVTLVWSDLGEAGRTPPVATTRALYLRLFGDRDLEEPFDRKRKDATATLEHWAARIREEGRDAELVDVLVSKYLEGYAPGTAEALARALGIDLAPAERPSGPRQTTLM